MKLVHAVLFKIVTTFNNNIYPSILRTFNLSPSDIDKLAEVSLFFFKSSYSVNAIDDL